MNKHINKRTRIVILIAFGLTWALASCTKDELIKPEPKEFPREKIRYWNDWIDPNKYPPVITDTTKYTKGW